MLKWYPSNVLYLQERSQSPTCMHSKRYHILWLFVSDDEGSDYGESISNIEVSEDDDEDYNPTTTAAHTFDKCKENSQALFSFLFSIFCFLLPLFQLKSNLYNTV